MTSSEHGRTRLAWSEVAMAYEEAMKSFPVR
jgi:hypothetical protein